MKSLTLLQVSAHVVSMILATISVSSLAAGEQEKYPENNLLSVSYLTLRNVTGEPDPEDRYGDERDTLRAGQCQFSRASLSLLQPLSRNGLVYIPENLNLLESVTETTASHFWFDFKVAAQGQRPILYLHGYNTSFEKACDQAALFQANLGLENRLILFSWPSDGALLNYPRDEADLYWSVASLEEILLQMVEQFGAGGFDVIAHSLGARGLVIALIQLAHRHHDQIPLLGQLILTAPDVDAGIFQQYLPGIRPLVQNISLYVSANDKPLALSEEVHGYPRLGQIGPDLDELEGIEIIDISDAGVRSYSGHLYHLYHEDVKQDLDLLLNRGFSAHQRDTLAVEANNRWSLKATDVAQ